MKKNKLKKDEPQPVLGVDVGGVLVARADGSEDTSFFGARPLETPALSGAFDTLARMTAGPFGGRVYVVSRAGPRTEATTRAWMAQQRFFQHTGIPATHLRFVRERADKAPVCEILGVTHFVDDRIDVLGHLTGVTHRFLFTGGLGRDDQPTTVPAWAIRVQSWTHLEELLVRRLPVP